MKRKFPIAISVAVILTVITTSLAFAAVVPAHIVFTADVPCAVTVVVDSHTDPMNQPNQPASGSTPWTLDTYPATSVTFYYPSFVVCGGTTYNFVSASPSSPLTSGAEDSTTTVIGYYVSSNTAPAITVNDVTEEGNTAGGWTLAFAEIGSASDVEDGIPSVSCTPAIGSTLPLGANSVSCIATDGSGLTATDSGTITVVDTTPATIADNPDMTVEGNITGGANVTFSSPAASDVVDAVVDVNCAPLSGSFFALGGPHTVTCTATDDSGNSSSSSFDITVVDTTAPSLVLPADIAEPAANASGAVVTYSVSALDLVDASPTVICSPASGTMFPLGITTVNCTATDDSGNSSSGSFTVAVQYTAAGIKCGGIAGHQILSPINVDGSSVFKQGSVIPAKFRVCTGDGQAIATSGVVTSFRLVQIIRAGSVSDVDQPVPSATSDPDFRFGKRQWIFNISTKNLVAGNTYVYLVTLNDGSTISFQFSLK